MIDIYKIPSELKQLRQWVCWKKEIKDGKETKIPYMTRNTRASVDKSDTWRDVFTCERHVNAGSVDGIGFVFTKDDPYCFIDLDHCIDEQGNIDPKAMDIIKRVNSYTEKSVSGRGIHIICKAKIPDGAGNRKDNFEIYDQVRYACMTGDVLDGYETIRDSQAVINELCQEIFKPSQEQAKPSTKPSKVSQFKLSSQEIIEKASKAENGAKFQRLFDGDIAGYPSQSEADLAFVSMLAFWTQDKDQIMDIVRQSRLYDKKWERKDYQNRTIDKALSELKETYNGGAGKNEKKTQDKEQVEDQEKAYKKYFVDGKFIPKLLVDELMAEYDFICVGGLLYIYLDGVWRPIGDDFIKQECYERLHSQARINRVNEVISHIRAITRTEQVKLNTYKELINVKNGMLNWKTRELHNHSKEYYSTIQIPVKYDPNADNTKITEWLETTLVDADLIQLACELIGYCLIPDTTMSKAFMLVGSGANGKSTFISVIERFIGKENVSKIPLQELADHRFKRADLFGKLVNVFADLDKRGLKSTSYFKTIVAGDTIDAERKNRDPFYFTPFARLIFSANEIPLAEDRSDAYYRRWIIIQFDQKFEGDKDNKNLLAELCTENNLSALLNNALDGLSRVMKRQSFTETKKGKKALKEYEKANNPVKAFVDECLEFDPSSEIDRKELYDAFFRFCDDKGYKETTRKYFYQRLRIYREIKEVRLADGFIFRGVKLKNIV